MKRRAALLVTGLTAAITLLVAPAASAQTWTCVGTERAGYVCVDPTGGTLYSDCVYLGGSSCTPVTIPGPIYGCGGPLACW